MRRGCRSSTKGRVPRGTEARMRYTSTEGRLKLHYYYYIFFVLLFALTGKLTWIRLRGARPGKNTTRGPRPIRESSTERLD